MTNPLRSEYLSEAELAQLEAMSKRADLLGEYASSRKHGIYLYYVIYINSVPLWTDWGNVQHPGNT